MILDCCTVSVECPSPIKMTAHPYAILCVKRLLFGRTPRFAIASLCRTWEEIFSVPDLCLHELKMLAPELYCYGTNQR